MIPKVLIAIPTYLRPKRLQRTLESVQKAVNTASPSLDSNIVVIDNDLNRSAMPIVEAFDADYVCEPNRGLSMVRNRALSMVHEYDALVFLDDDEWVDSAWLLELVDSAHKHSADVVQGRVSTILPSQRPWTLRDPYLFQRLYPNDGSELRVAATNNSLIQTKCLKGLNYPKFSLHYNFSGGEDSEFFSRIHGLGAKIIFADRAIVYEDLTATRLTLSGVAKRSFNQGAAYSSKSNRNRAVAPIYLLRALGRIGYGFIELIWSLLIRQNIGGIAFKRILNAAGSICGLFGYSPTPYLNGDVDSK